MDVRIGIADVAREVNVTTDTSADELVAALGAALESGGLFEVVDEKGRRVIIPAARIGYVDLGSTEVRPVGFGAV